MDPISLAALTSLLGKLFDGAAGEAGAKSLDALGRLLGRVTHGRHGRHMARLRDGKPTNNSLALATELVEAATVDPAFARALVEWMAEASVVAEGTVTNAVVGPVKGKVVQGRDIGRVDIR